MKNRILSLVFLLFPWIHSTAQLVTGIESIIDQKFYVVHSGNKLNGTLNNTSNIYIIRGINDTVWIFGCGYGDSSEVGNESDVYYYATLKNLEKDAVRSGAKDAQDADLIIQSDFGFSPGTTRLMFLVPHGHEDHVNQEFIAAFFENHDYNLQYASILIHIGDVTMATCNDKCCGTPDCTQTNYYYRSPFNDPWTSTYLDIFQILGNNKYDACNKVLKKFTSSAGKWTIQHNKNLLHGGHTDGTLNLANASLKFRLEGSESGTHCPLPAGYIVFPVHGNLPAVAPKKDPYDSTQSIPAAEKICKQPVFVQTGTHQITLKLDQALNESTLSIFNIYGQRMNAKVRINETSIELDTRDLPFGIYAYAITMGQSIICKGILIIPND